MGYAGGTSTNPTYHNLDGHSETIQIDYDPAQVSYRQLLEVFWHGHNPATPAWSQQYASKIFYHDEEQRRLAQGSKEQYEAHCDCEVHTEIVAADAFYLAEDYHQKYRLQGWGSLMSEFAARYPDPADFVDSTAAARVNGYLAGYGTLADLEAEIDDLGLSARAQKELLDLVRSRQ